MLLWTDRAHSECHVQNSRFHLLLCALWISAVNNLTKEDSCHSDGFVDLSISLACVGPTACQTDRVELSIPIRHEVAHWMMGLSAVSGSWPPRLYSTPANGGGRQGTARTRTVGFAWQDYSESKPRMQAWFGNLDAGLRIKLKGTGRASSFPRYNNDSASVRS